MKRWKVCKRAGEWRVYDRGVWWDTYPSLQDAHSWALRCAVTDELWAADGITRLRELLDAADWWRAYQSACAEVSA